MYDGLNLHMLEIHGKHYDEDLCILQVVHPVVRKAVRKTLISRLRRLGMGCEYDVSRLGPITSITVLTGTFQTVKRDPELNAEPHQYAYGTASVDIHILAIPRNRLRPWTSMFAS